MLSILLTALLFSTSTVYYVAEDPKEVALNAIAVCETRDRHFVDGEVIRGELTPEDIGRYQINEYYWGDTAEKMGLDIYNENDNREFAEWLYNRYGLKPWSASRDCIKNMI